MRGLPSEAMGAKLQVRELAWRHLPPLAGGSARLGKGWVELHVPIATVTADIY